jgi:predicted GNAT family acetyltransferase
MIAAAYYRDERGTLSFVHTEVPEQFSGAGIATDLARGTFELLRKSGRKAILVCPFMVHFFTKHPEYADVVAVAPLRWVLGDESLVGRRTDATEIDKPYVGLHTPDTDANC